MTPDEARKAVGDHAEVVAYYSGGAEVGRGRVVAYSIVPTVTIVRDDGSRFDWRHDMVEVAEDQTAREYVDELRAAGVPVTVDDPAERLRRYNEADKAQNDALHARMVALLDGVTSRRWRPIPLREPQTAADAVRRVLAYHRDVTAPDRFADECLCGWQGERWQDHVTPLLVRAAQTLEVVR